MNLLLAQAEVDGRIVDVRVSGSRVVEVAAGLRPQRDEQVVDARGGALLPGLHDHHLHLLAVAAAARSVPCGPPEVEDSAALADVLQTAAAAVRPGQWVRGTGYAEHVAGPLDRDVLDRLVPDRPVRVQHRGGALWMLNSAAVSALDLEQVDDPAVERDASGRVTGRLWRYDAQLRARLPAAERPDLHAVGTRLSRYGITGVTDATPDLDPAAVSLLADAHSTGALPQRLLLLGAPQEELPPGLAAGPRKLLLPDHDLPPFDELVETIGRTHARGRAVAVHCVTREALVLTVVALESAGRLDGDRIEHAGVVPPELRGRLAALGLRVVTQPSFIARRGDDYLREVDADDVPCLYPYASLLAAGVPVAASSDAPFGDLDPWRTIAAATARRTRSDAELGANERVPADVALAGLLSPLTAPGEAPRRIDVGAPADLCVLDAPLATVLREPDADRVRLVLCDGEVTAESSPPT